MHTLPFYTIALPRAFPKRRPGNGHDPHDQLLRGDCFLSPWDSDQIEVSSQAAMRSYRVAALAARCHNIGQQGSVRCGWGDVFHDLTIIVGVHWSESVWMTETSTCTPQTFVLTGRSWIADQPR